MGQGTSFGKRRERHSLIGAVQRGDIETVGRLYNQRTKPDSMSPLHFAAIHGQIQILMFLLNRIRNPDVFNSHQQTPLMLAAMHGKVDCVEELLYAGASVLTFDSVNGRTCLHYAAHNGHLECLRLILYAAQTSPVPASWGFERFVNTKDKTGATALHLAARQGWFNCVNTLLYNGAMVFATTTASGYCGSTALHFAARGGSAECIRELLAWGADRLLTDEHGKTPYVIALKQKHKECASLLNPSLAEPLVWPLPLRFVFNLCPEAKSSLENALAEANKEREELNPDEKTRSVTCVDEEDDDVANHGSEVRDEEICGICLDRKCTIRIGDCGHRMCARCTLSLCCHKKPDLLTGTTQLPFCPYCRCEITRLVGFSAMEAKHSCMSPARLRRSRRSSSSNEGTSSSFKGLPMIDPIMQNSLDEAK